VQVNAGSASPSTESPLVWRSRILRLSLAAVPTWFTVAVLVFNTPWRTKLLVGSVFATALVSPSRGLLAVAALTPLGHLLETGLGLEPFRIGEAIVIAFLAGWLLRERGDRSGPRVPAIAAWSLAGVAGASVAAQAWSVAVAHPGELPDTLQTLYQAYYLLPDRIGFGVASRLVEGLALLAATTTLFRATPRLAVTLPATMTITAVLAAASSVLVTRGVAPAAILAEHARGWGRTSAHIGDVNAAASYFGMLLFVALGMAARRPSALSALWLAAAIGETAALWLTGSRTGTAAAAIVFGVAAVCAVTSEWRPTMRAVLVATVLFAAAAAGGARMWMLRNDPGASFRQQFTATSLRMIAARPVLGVGVGRYYDASALFLTPQMAWVYGFQNAHNQFLQIAAELGLVGVALFLVLIGVVVARGARAVGVRAQDMRLLGCVAAVVALLMTCLAGHPLLLDEVAFTFWMLVGLVAGLGGSIFVGRGGCGTGGAARAEGAERTGRAAAVAAMAVVGLAAGGDLLVARQPLTPPSSIAVDGLEPWETDADGTRYRWTREYASVFVPWNVTRVYIPARLPVDLPQIPPMLVDAHVSGVGAGSTLVGDSWTVINVQIPPLSSLQRYKRVDLRVPRTWQPAIYLPGSRDLRKVGVQVGEVKLFYEY
jgi:O-antigen ligase